jgi:hypothetical protein
MDLFKGIALFIGWLTSSAAGIAVLLYSCGYLISRAQLHLLGLFGLIDQSNDYFLQEGAKFFVAVAGDVIGLLVFWMFIAGIALLPVVVVLALLALWPGIWRQPWLERLERWREWLATSLQRHGNLLRSLVLVSLASVLVFYLTMQVNKFTPPLQIANLLYEETPGTSASSQQQQLTRWLVAPDATSEQETRGYFRELLLADVEAGVVLALAWYVAAPWRARFWLTMPFILVFTGYTILVPMAYGVLVRPISYAMVSLKMNDKADTTLARELYLLNRSDQGFLLWNPCTRRVLWLPKDGVASAEVTGIAPLFRKDPKCSVTRSGDARG